MCITPYLFQNALNMHEKGKLQAAKLTESSTYLKISSASAWLRIEYCCSFPSLEGKSSVGTEECLAAHSSVASSAAREYYGAKWTACTAADTCCCCKRLFLK